MAEKRDYYEILGVARDVSAEDLKACSDSLTDGLTSNGHAVTPGGI